MRPRLVYVTFMHEEGHDLLEKKKSIEFMDETMEFRQAKQPSNFHWENIQITDKTRQVRGCLVVMVMIAFFFIFFLIAMVTIKYKLLIQYEKNPPGIECDQVIDFYGDKLEDLAAYEYLNEFELLKQDTNFWV